MSSVQFERKLYCGNLEIGSICVFMINYRFEVLNDKEFENLSRDLLQAELKIRLETFKTGKDDGIDFRYATTKNKNEIIVQAKHWAGSGFM